MSDVLRRCADCSWIRKNSAFSSYGLNSRAPVVSVAFGGGGLCGVDWLARPLVADGVEVAEPLDPARLTDGDLRSICQRMLAILDTVEMPRCEGRLLPAKLFDAIDTLASRVRHGPQPRLTEWASV